MVAAETPAWLWHRWKWDHSSPRQCRIQPIPTPVHKQERAAQPQGSVHTYRARGGSAAGRCPVTRINPYTTHKVIDPEIQTILSMIHGHPWVPWYLTGDHLKSHFLLYPQRHPFLVLSVKTTTWEPRKAVSITWKIAQPSQAGQTSLLQQLLLCPWGCPEYLCCLEGCTHTLKYVCMDWGGHEQQLHVHSQ